VTYLQSMLFKLAALVLGFVVLPAIIYGPSGIERFRFWLLTRRQKPVVVRYVHKPRPSTLRRAR
jgi:hypothetical protein